MNPDLDVPIYFQETNLWGTTSSNFATPLLIIKIPYGGYWFEPYHVLGRLPFRKWNFFIGL